ncbi:MAG: hypothetical protein HY882_11855 [Deltaproteobacteria bacterium]|nr:hypothetical protein [Deltaproteobacteria bacterium]
MLAIAKSLKIKSLHPFFLFLVMVFSTGFSSALTVEEIAELQPTLQGKTTGEKIAFWAEKFIGTPYDEDPQGDYVIKAMIVADEKIDCMYLTFRAVELALSNTPEEAIQIALGKRFHSRGVLKDGKVVNYDNRFQYGEDMITSGKWGKEITFEIGRHVRIKGSRGRDFCHILPTQGLLRGMKNLESGDILFFITPPEKRKADEIVGHIGIIKTEEKFGRKEVHLIHASGIKNKGGVVKKVPLKEYISTMPFVGVKITRFE